MKYKWANETMEQMSNVKGNIAAISENNKLIVRFTAKKC